LACLSNPRLEHFAQLVFAGKSADDAARGAGYPDGTSFSSNARKRSQRRDVRARVAELQARTAEAAVVDKTFILLALKDLLEFNLVDYLDPQGKRGRTIDIDNCTPEQLYRLQEIARDRKGALKLKGYDKVAILALLAKTAGIDRDQTADALTGIGQRLAAAIKRMNAAQGSGR
jgi:hypothetical protein